MNESIRAAIASKHLESSTQKYLVYGNEKGPLLAPPMIKPGIPVADGLVINAPAPVLPKFPAVEPLESKAPMEAVIVPPAPEFPMVRPEASPPAVPVGLKATICEPENVSPLLAEDTGSVVPTPVTPSPFAVLVRARVPFPFATPPTTFPKPPEKSPMAVNTEVPPKVTVVPAATAVGPMRFVGTAFPPETVVPAAPKPP